ncbi:MAG: class I SAM-dependent methyltransferase [Bacteroidetes bacterium]|nr:class I SAM-dependent methyltransferase [Bacteroidota bacterium]
MEPNSLIEKIFNSMQVQDDQGNVFKLSGNIDRTEGDYIYDIIKQNKDISKTLEIGCGYGLSSLFICSALQKRDNAKHTIIDPFQYKEYYGIGITNLKRTGCTFFELIEEPSEYALAKLTQTQTEALDLIFIDGWHTFDHIMLDLFYSNRLLKIGGYLIIDDCRLPSIAKAISYFSKYPAYKIHSQTNNSNLSFRAILTKYISRTIPEVFIASLLPLKLSRFLNRVKFSSMITLIKLKNDERGSRWYSDF